jgi:type IV pilus assembly protein PilW
MIEMLVSMVLGAVLLGGMLQILMSTKQSYNLQEGLSRIQENGRFAMSLVTRDIRMAGFLGCSRLVAPVNIANAPISLPPPSITGNNNVTNNWNTSFCGASNACIAGTDAIAVIHANSCGAVVTALMAAVTDNIPIAATNTCNIAAGDPLIVADCANSDIFRATNAATTSVAHSTASNSSASLSKVYGTDAEVLSYSALSYFIRVSSNAATPTVSSLWRFNNNIAASTTNPIEIVEGIEDMQILYGADTDAPQDGTANFYVPAGTVGLTMAQVVSVRITMLVASADDNLVANPAPYLFNGNTVTPTDRKIRRVFTSTIAVRNMLP